MILCKTVSLRVVRITRETPSKLQRSYSNNRRGLVASLQGIQTPGVVKSTASVPKGGIHPPRLQLQKQAIVVEGLADKRAVQKAVPDAVFVLGSSKWVEGRNSERIIESLRQGLPRFERVVVLMDPDVAGRQGRNVLEAAFPGQLWHAFLPAQQATSLKATRWHGAGNIGIEHASPDSIRQSIAACRQASPTRKHFSREQLIGLELTSTFTNVTVQTKRRREAVCDHLGIGHCDGKQLLKQLNLYNFTENDLQEALQDLNECEGNSHLV